MSEIDQLRAEVCAANRALPAHGLVTLTWGNASGISKDRRLVAIKPSGVPYQELNPQDIVVVDMMGRVAAGLLKPSTDTATHLELYRAFPAVGGIVHTHSLYATMFAQARRPIPCLGTTHADHFAGAVPVTRQLRPEEMGEYEKNTGRLIAERLGEADAANVPAVLVAAHGPFAWGPTVAKAVENAVALEAVARMALGTLVVNAEAGALEAHVLAKHHERKHGKGRYYGQA